MKLPRAVSSSSTTTRAWFERTGGCSGLTTQPSSPAGADALALLSKKDNFELILCDLMMPEIDGPQVYASLMASAPHIAQRIVFCTGGAFTTRTRAFLEAIENEIVEKPLSHDDVSRLLRRART